MCTQCNSKLLEFEGHCSRRRRSVAKKLIFFRFFFVVLRAPSWISFSLSVFLRGPSRTPFESFPTSWSPLADLSFTLLTDTSAPSWKSFPPSRPLADPSRSISNPLVALRRSSWPFVEIFLPFRGNPFSPWRSLAGPSRASSNPFVPLRGYLFPLVSFFVALHGPLSSLFQPLGIPWRINLLPS